MVLFITCKKVRGFELEKVCVDTVWITGCPTATSRFPYKKKKIKIQNEKSQWDTLYDHRDIDGLIYTHKTRCIL